MFLKDKQTDNLIKIVDIESLINPSKNSISGKVQSGQEEQDTTDFAKESLQFPSGEELPRCWMDADYQQN
ncbi:MAG: acetyltransferase [Potamolinea sp.]